MRLTQVARILANEALIDDVMLSSVSIDTRTIQKNAIFFAIDGDRYDGHDFVPQAIAGGAAAIVASRDISCDVPVIQVGDVRAALMQVAVWWRSQFSPMTFSITGSCGKTSTRAFLQGIYSQCCSVIASEKSYNNSIGVALTLLRLDSACRAFITELGTNAPGEIAPLSQMVNPDVAIITNAGPVHLSGLKTVAGVAKEKGSIIQGLSPAGILVLNADDTFLSYWEEQACQLEVVTFGIEQTADVMARSIRFDDKKI